MTEKRDEKYCTAMGTAGKQMKERLYWIRNYRGIERKARVFSCMVALILGMFTVFTGVFSFASESELTKEQQLMDQWKESIVLNYIEDTLSFTIPPELPKGKGLYLQDGKDGTLLKGEPGKTYTYSFSQVWGDEFAVKVGVIKASSANVSTDCVNLSRNGAIPVRYFDRYADWQSGYQAVLEDLFELGCVDQYALVDLDFDGSLELFASSSKKGLSGLYYTYSFSDKTLKYLGDADFRQGGDPEAEYIKTKQLLLMVDKEGMLDAERINSIPFYPITSESVKTLAVSFANSDEKDLPYLLAANRWAGAYASRDGITRYNLLTPEKQAVFFEEDQTVVSEKSFFEEKGFISIRGSSPWVNGYSLEVGEDESVTIHYTLGDSAVGVYSMTEKLHFASKDGGLKVDEYSTSNMKGLFQDTYDTVEEAVSAVILQVNGRNNDTGKVLGEGHKLLMVREKKDSYIVVVYLLASFGEYEMKEGGYTRISGTDVSPMIITLGYDDDGGYYYLSSWSPSEGAEYTSSIRGSFPFWLWGKATPNKAVKDEILAKERTSIEARK